MTASKLKGPFEIAWKHKDHGSDVLGVSCRTLKSAVEHIQQIQENPGQFGYHEWVKDAFLWVVDADGNLAE